MKPGMITCDCVDPFYLADWWREQLGWSEVMRDGEAGFAVIGAPDGAVNIAFQRVPDPTPGKNKVHIDFSSDDVEGDIARLIAAGAQEVQRVEYPGIAWTTLADPEGNQFCISAAH